MKNRLSALAFVVALVVYPPPAISMTPILLDLYNLYAPDVHGAKMWTGGWLTSQDTEDAIYISDFSGGVWSTPQAVFSKPGWHVNDPNVVAPPSTDGVDRSGWLYLYYTALDLSCTDIPDCWFENNVVGLATSIDGGYSWTDLGVIISTANGVDNCGAWAPSAIVVGDEIWLYAHGAFGHNGCPPSTYRWMLNANGWQVEEAGTVSVPRLLDNVDVAYAPDGSFVLAGNAPSLTKIYYYTSQDGETFSVPASNPNDEPLIDGGTLWVNTPELTFDAAGNMQVWFGWPGAGDPAWHIRQVHRWTFPITF